jgi:hypothetical protein
MMKEHRCFVFEKREQGADESDRGARSVEGHLPSFNPVIVLSFESLVIHTSQEEVQMTNLPQIIHLATTDADFCAALQVAPQAALAKRGLEANDEELAALAELHSLIATPPQKLSVLLASTPLQDWRSVVPAPALAI